MARAARKVADRAGGSAPASARLPAALFVTGMIALSFNLRSPVTSLPPVFPELASRLRLSSAAVTVLATIPVVSFGVFSGFTARLGRRFGDERTAFAALLVLAGSLALRAGLPGPALFPATVLAMAAIAIMNVLLSGLVKRRMPVQAGLVIGLCLLSLSIGSIAGSAASVPVYQASGSIRLVLGLWVVPVALAAVIWLPQVWRPARRVGAGATTGRAAGAPGAGGHGAGASGTGGHEMSGPEVGGPSADRRLADGFGRTGRVVRGSVAGHPVYRHALAWQVAGFMGLQSLAFYATLSWFPILFRDRGASAAQGGVLISLALFGGAITSLLVPVLAQRTADQRPLVVPTVLVCGAGITAALYAPMSQQAFWMFVLGLGQGAALGLAFFFTMARSATPRLAASLSSLAQGAGYLLASTGPLAVGFLHTLTSGWQVPVVLLLVVSGVQLTVGYFAARPRLLG